MNLFWLAIDLSPEGLLPQNDKFISFKKAFSANRNFNEWSDKNHYFSFEPSQNHFFRKTTEHTCHYFLGRDAKTNLIETEFGLDTTSCQFPFLHIFVDKLKKTVSVNTDPFGFYSYFYSFKGSQVVISNFLPSIIAFNGDRLMVSEQNYTELLLFGTTLPGKTIYSDIFMSHPLENLTISSDTFIRKTEKSPLHPSSEPKIEDIYGHFKGSVHSILKTSQINWVNLTGGSDTRLVLSTLSKSERESLTFVFDEISSNPNHIPYDRAVIKTLQSSLNLNVKPRFPFHFLSPQKGFHDGAQSYSPYNQLMTGMYGGEIMGGNAMHSLPQPIHLNRQNESPLVQEAEYNRQESMRLFRKYTNQNDDFFFHVALFTNSFMSFIYEDSNWLYPYVLLQKKISPYINTFLFRDILQLGFDKVNNYQLYARIYQSCAPEMMKYPFFSRITAFNYPGFNAQATDDKHLFLHTDQHKITYSMPSISLDLETTHRLLPQTPEIVARSKHATKMITVNLQHAQQ